MNTQPPRPAGRYDAAGEAAWRDMVYRALQRVFSIDRNIELGAGLSVILRTSTGARKRLSVHDDNTVTCEDA